LHNSQKKHSKNRCFWSALVAFKTIPSGIISRQRYGLFFSLQNYFFENYHIGEANEMLFV